MLDYAFTVQGLHAVMLTVYEYNRAGQRAYAKAGFRPFGHSDTPWWSSVIGSALGAKSSPPGHGGTRHGKPRAHVMREPSCTWTRCDRYVPISIGWLGSAHNRRVE